MKSGIQAETNVDEEVSVGPLETEAIEYFISFAQLIGYPKSVGEIYGILFVSHRALALDDVVKALGISRGSASQGLSVLRGLGAIEKKYLVGERRDYYQPVLDLERIAQRFFQERLEPRLGNGRRQIERLEQLRQEQGREDLLLRVQALRKWHEFACSALPLLLGDETRAFRE